MEIIGNFYNYFHFHPFSIYFSFNFLQFICCFDYLGSQCVGEVPRLKGWLLFGFKEFN
jgi:hypothetical protein